MITTLQALQSLLPNVQVIMVNGEISEWIDERTQPTDEAIATEQARLQAEYDAKEYARARSSVYPSITEFMEAYTEKEIGGDSTKWDAYVVKYNQVRTDNPKPA